MSSTKSLRKVGRRTIITQLLTIVLRAMGMLGFTMTTGNALTKMMLISGQMKAIMKVICDH